LLGAGRFELPTPLLSKQARKLYVVYALLVWGVSDHSNTDASQNGEEQESTPCCETADSF